MNDQCLSDWCFLLSLSVFNLFNFGHKVDLYYPMERFNYKDLLKTKIRDNRPHLFLVGFMGTGKSSIGRHIAQRLKMPFIDSDAAIEAREGRTIAQIFKAEGEAHFRNLERDFITSQLPLEGGVVACGGGMVMTEGLPELLHEKGIIICLFASVTTILERTSRSQNRPLLNVSDPEHQIRELLAQREPVYMRCGTGISTENRSVHDIAAHAIRIYLYESRRRKLSDK